MKTKIKKYLKEILFFTLFLFVTLNILSYYKSLELNKKNLNITTFDLVDNTQFTVDSKKPLLIHFWATWCPICKIEASNIEYLSKNFQVVTIAVQEKSKEVIQNYLQTHNLTFKVVDDYNGNLAKKFNIQVYPTTFIYDTNGNLKFSEVGYTSTLGLYIRMLLANF